MCPYSHLGADLLHILCKCTYPFLASHRICTFSGAHLHMIIAVYWNSYYKYFLENLGIYDLSGSEPTISAVNYTLLMNYPP